MAYLVDEISCLKTPALWNLVLFYLCLFCEDGISDFSSTLTLVGSTTEHALPSYDTHCKVVRCDPMVIFAHYLWSHVTGSTTSLITIINVGYPFTRNTEIC